MPWLIPVVVSGLPLLKTVGAIIRKRGHDQTGEAGRRSHLTE
jgi:hypothetical protein